MHGQIGRWAAEHVAAQPPHDERRGALGAKVDGSAKTSKDADRAVGCGRELHGTLTADTRQEHLNPFERDI